MNVTTFPLTVFFGSMLAMVGLLIYYFSWITGESSQQTCVPDLEASRSPEGYQLIDRTFSFQNLLGFIFALVLLGGVAGAFYALEVYASLSFLDLVKKAQSNLSTVNFGFLAVLGLLVALMFGFMLIGTLLKAFKSLRLNEAVLTLEKWPVPLGESCKISFERSIPVNMEINDIQAKLTCLETTVQGNAQRMSDDNTQFFDTVVQKSLDTEVSPARDGTVRLNWTLDLPENSPQSFEAARNSYSWTLAVTLDINNFPDDSSSFELLVLPKTANVKN